MHYIERNIEIDAPVERVFDLFSDFESMPRWMKNLAQVRYTGRRHIRWTAESPYGDRVEWETETTDFEPDRRIAWHSVRGDLRTEGEAIFEETQRGNTWLRVVLGFDDRDGRVIRNAFGDDPARQLEENLEQLADVAEGRRPLRKQRTSGLQIDRDDRDVSFERAHWNARRPREESRQQYTVARELDEQRYNYSDDRERRDDRRRMAIDRRYLSEVPEAPRRRYEETEGGQESEARYRFALTPRERAAERNVEDEMQRRRRYDESSRFMRRGIDRLMDEPPSSRWNER
jgi:uncharacterized protein YndB with AHSA1/START domain